MKVGFIGCGNMGGALAASVAKVCGAELYICDTNSQRCEDFKKSVNCEISDAQSIAKTCDFIFFAIKPGGFATLVPTLADSISKNPDSVVVTIAAGVKIGRLEELLGKPHKIIRIMPNTPVLVNEGMVTYCKNEAVCESDEQSFKKLMAYCGRLDRLDEREIDAASAVAGCGPAFAYMFAEALADGGVECGLTRDKALLYASQMLKGAAEMLLATGKHPGVLKDEVCSPGGSTIEGVHALEDGAFRSLCQTAVVAAFEKTKKLGK